MRVTDPLGRTAKANFTTTVVANTNSAPVYASGTLTPQAAVEGQPFSYALPANSFTDANGDPLTYSAQLLIGSSWTGLPALGLAINASTGTISGSLTGPTQTSYTVKITASDGLATASGSFTLTVNRKPVATPIPAQTAVVNTAFTFTFAATTFTDPNGSPLTYTASGLPAGLGFNPATRTFSGTPTQTGTATLTVTASDGVTSTATSFTLTVSATAGNALPVLVTPIPNQAVPAGDDVSFTVPDTTFSDPDGQALSYTATGLPPWLHFDAATRTFSGTAPLWSLTRSIKVTATDPQGGSVSDTFVLAVQADGLPRQQQFFAGGSPPPEESLIPIEDPGDPGDPQDPPPNGGGGTPDAAHTGYWFSYDGENRVQVVNGALQDGVIVTTHDDSSYVLTYTASGQVASRMLKVGGVDQLEVSQYDARGQLLYVFQPITLGAPAPTPGTPGALKEARSYDALGRLVEQSTFYAAGETRNGIAIGGWRKHTERYEYNADGQVVRQLTRGHVLGWTALAYDPGHAAGEGLLVDL